MAVVAGGDFRGYVWLSQGHGLAVIRIPVMCQPIFVASTAALIAGHFEMAILGRFNFVSGVAVAADGTVFTAVCRQMAVDALIVSFLDPDVAFAAGLCDVGGIDGRVPVHCALDV